MASGNIPVAAPDIVWREVDEGVVLVSPEQGEVRVLNEVGTMIWQLLDGEHTLQDIEEQLLARYDVPRAQIQKDLSTFLNELAEKQLLTWQK